MHVITSFNIFLTIQKPNWKILIEQSPEIKKYMTLLKNRKTGDYSTPKIKPPKINPILQITEEEIPITQQSNVNFISNSFNNNYQQTLVTPKLIQPMYNKLKSDSGPLFNINTTSITSSKRKLEILLVCLELCKL